MSSDEDTSIAAPLRRLLASPSMADIGACWAAVRPGPTAPLARALSGGLAASCPAFAFASGYQSSTFDERCLSNCFGPGRCGGGACP